MNELQLSVALGDYDRNRPLITGEVRIDGVRPIFMTLDPEEIFFQAMRAQAFDICELSLSSHTMCVAEGRSHYVGVPAFVSRAFRHTSFYVRLDRGLDGPGSLRGKRVGVPEYQLTACVYARAILAEHGVAASDVTWVRGGLEHPGRVEKLPVALPDRIRLEDARRGATLSQLLVDGEIDAIITPRAPSCFYDASANVGWLFPDPVAEARAYYARTGVFPIMHLVGVRRTLAEQHPWLPSAVLKAFGASKAAALGRLSDTSATKVTLPFVEEHLRQVRTMMGEDFWPYGLENNLGALDHFLEQHHRQGLSKRQVSPAELFHPSTVESHRI